MENEVKQLNKELEQNFSELQMYKELLKSALNAPLCVEMHIESMVTKLHYLYWQNEQIRKKIIEMQVRENAMKVLYEGGAN